MSAHDTDRAALTPLLDRSAAILAGHSVHVWDIGVRGFHWLLVVVVTVSAVTGFVLGRTALAWHLVAGAAMVMLLVWRLTWGALGSTYARFSSCTHPPAAVLAHMREMRAERQCRHLGHNPLGALMVFAFIAVLAVIAATGTLTLGGLLKQGPLRAFLSYTAGQQWLRVHNVLAILLLCMIGAHLAGVAFESWRGRVNLVRAMVTGKKPFQQAAQIAPATHAKPWHAGAITVAVAAVGAGGVAVLAALPGRGVPPRALDPVYAEQCGACHLAYPPSLAPASTWNGILGDLKQHFGADASLSPDLVAHIRAYLDTNAAAHWDTLPSHLLRAPAPNGSLRITDTPGWQKVHRDIPAAVFAAKSVGRRSACEACHADAATGRFAPQQIAIPDSGS
jgi:cytochrome b